MNTISNAGIGVRLGMAFGMLVLLLVGCATFGAVRMSSLNDTMQSVITRVARSAVLAVRLEGLAHEVGSALRDAVLSDGSAEIQRELQLVAKLRKESDATQKELQAAIETNNGHAALHAVLASQPQYLARLDAVAAAINAGDSDAARGRIVSPELRQYRTAYVDALEKLVVVETEGMETARAGAQSTYATSRNLLIAAVVTAALAAIFIGWWVTRSIIRPINDAVKLAETVAAGDLSSHIEVAGNDETAQMLRALQRMNSALVQIVGGVRAGTDSIATASRQIAAGNAHLSQRTEEQATSLERTAASMEELTTAVRQNADNAGQANQLAARAREVAVKGGAVVSEVVTTMDSINDSSKKIADIIGVIDGIAFQTNILALNAAVEAARAGEQGRGFAVVASEVRSLAQRSAAAAKEIKTLIGDSVAKVDTGAKLVNEAGKTMDEVVVSIKRVTDIMGEITSASVEQSAGIEQVNEALAEMDQVTQQNATLVERAAAAADSMQGQAEVLSIAVAVFKLDAETHPVKRPMSPEPAPTPRASVTKTVAERRGPDRAKNVTRMSRKGAEPVAMAKSGTDDEWTEF